MTAATLRLHAPNGSSVWLPRSMSSRTYHSRLAAEVALELDRHEPIRGEARDHEDPRVGDSLGGDHLIDAPSAGDQRGLSRRADAGAQRARHHVEETADHRRALGEAGRRRGLGGHAADNLGRVDQIREHGSGVSEAVAVEQALVVAAVRQAQEAGPAHVGDVRDTAPGQLPGHEVLAEEGRAGPGVDLGGLLAQPGEKRRRLRRPRCLQAERVQPPAVVPSAQLLGDAGGTRVERLDGEERPAVPVEQVESVAVAGAADRRQRARTDAGTLQALADHHGGVCPELVEVALHVAGRRRVRGAVALARDKLVALAVEEHRLDDGIAGIEAKQQAGLSHPGRPPRPLRRRRRGGSSPSGRQRRA